MDLRIATTEKVCPREEIAAYVDGEIPPREELELELHFAACRTCSDELNSQKKLLCALDSIGRGREEIELPEDFTKVVVTAAESKVSGLRRPQERRKALFVCAILFLLFVIAGETQVLFGSVGAITEQIAAAGSVFVHFVYDITLGITIILRSLSNHLVFSSSVSFFVITVVLLISLLTLSRLFIRHDRA
jgi:anti-sigma factor RsiW